MVLARIRSLFEQLIAQGQSSAKLAFTCALGIYIAISPFAGFHTVMVFVLGWIFSLNIPALLAVSMLISNPWTMIPIYAVDHFFGVWFFNTLHIDYTQFDPSWLEPCNAFLKQHTGITGLSLTAFLVGGNLLAIVISVMLYPIVKRIFALYLPQKK